ncbi:MAG: response regulator [Gemmatimonadota bacterium]|nr:response regulator [Gemmatimonadota bacterium]
MKRILITDSHKHLRLLYKTEFEADGYLVDTAADAGETLRLLERKSYDLLILDFLNSRDEAIEELRKLLSVISGLPVIVNSSYDSNPYSLLSWNTDSYVFKSSDLSELKQKVEESLGETVFVLEAAR